MLSLNVFVANYGLCPVIYTEVHTNFMTEPIDDECLN